MRNGYRKKWVWHGVLLGLLLGVAPRALAQSEPAQAEAAGPRHRLSLYCTAGNLLFYLSDARTAGGFGGGFGLRDTVDERFILQADLSYLMLLGNSVALRVGAGVQGQGLYTPAALVTLTALLGDRLNFLTPQHPTPIAGPGVTVGVNLAPLRFHLEGVEVSALELGVGVGTDLPGLGLSWRLGLLEVGTSF